jgi:hypothetical protein
MISFGKRLRPKKIRKSREEVVRMAMRGSVL